jgi:hypothetical protein
VDGWAVDCGVASDGRWGARVMMAPHRGAGRRPASEGVTRCMAGWLGGGTGMAPLFTFEG